MSFRRAGTLVIGLPPSAKSEGAWGKLVATIRGEVLVAFHHHDKNFKRKGFILTHGSRGLSTLSASSIVMSL